MQYNSAMPKRGISLPPEEITTLGELVRFLRERAMLTQRDLAARVGYHYSYISRIEKNVHIPGIATLMGRFIPALEIQSEPEWSERLLELASGIPKKLPLSTDAATPVVHEEKVYRPPSSLTALLGREKESEQIIESLQRGDIRILTLIGPPGVGKTRLSLHVAEKLAAQFVNGAVFVNLAPISDHTMVLTALGAALDVHESSDASIQSMLETFLQKKSLLIVMDNFEQVLQATPALTGILHYATGVKFLATSREALRVSGEYEFQLEPLTLPTDINAKKHILFTSPAIQLFVQRARAVSSSFELTDENASRVAEICLRLDGLPLAIELAAARIQTISPTAMLQQFERRFDWLTRGRSDSPTWRQTLSGAIDWSYRLLSEPERILFHRLSVLEGSWDLEAAENICCDKVICSPGEIFNLLLHLSDRSLVVVETKEDRTRYRYLDTIRHFAREKLEQSGEVTELRNRHLNHFTEWAEQMESLMNKIPPLEFRQSVEQEHSNIHAALRWALDSKTASENGFRLVTAISTVWLKLSYYKQALEWAEAFLPRATEAAQKNHRARLLYLKAALSYWRDNFNDALAAGLEAEKLARELSDKKLLANILYYLGGSIYREMGEYAKAEGCLQESITLCRENKLYSRLSIALTSFGIVLFNQGKKDESRQVVEEAFQIATRENDLWGQGYALRVQADNLRFERKFAESLTVYKRALEIALAIDDRISMGMELANMSLLTNVLEDYRASGDYAESALSVFRRIGNEYQQPFPLRMMAYAALHTANIEHARALCIESLRGNQKIGHKTGMLACMIALSEIELISKNISQTARLFLFVKTQLEKDALQLMEPDQATAKRLEIKLSNTNTQKAQQDISGLSMEEMIQELNITT
jgi:predicted ATPase